MAHGSRSPYTTLQYRSTRQDSETKTVRTPRRRVAPPAAERDGRDPRGIPKLNPVKALKQVQRHRFFPRKQTRWAISRRARISSCAGASSKTYPSAGSHGRERASAPNRRAWTIRRSCWRHRCAWRSESSGVIRGQVACTGIHCGRVALTDARGLTLDMARQRERLSHTDRTARLNVRGGRQALGRPRAFEPGREARRLCQDAAVIRMPAASPLAGAWERKSAALVRRSKRGPTPLPSVIASAASPAPAPATA